VCEHLHDGIAFSLPQTGVELCSSMSRRSAGPVSTLASISAARAVRSEQRISAYVHRLARTRGRGTSLDGFARTIIEDPGPYFASSFFALY
jgi:hypothetical protein